jgi:hypothetical protein
MQHNTAENINLASLTFWSNNWGVLYFSIASIKALDVGILSGFAWLDIFDPNALVFVVIYEVV